MLIWPTMVSIFACEEQINNRCPKEMMMTTMMVVIMMMVVVVVVVVVVAIFVDSDERELMNTGIFRLYLLIIMLERYDLRSSVFLYVDCLCACMPACLSVCLSPSLHLRVVAVVGQDQADPFVF